MSEEKEEPVTLGQLITARMAGMTYGDVSRQTKVPIRTVRLAEVNRPIRKEALERLLIWIGPAARHATYPPPWDPELSPPTTHMMTHPGRKGLHNENANVAFAHRKDAEGLLDHICAGGVLENYEGLDPKLKGDRLAKRVGRWLRKDKKFAQEFAEAKEAAAWMLLDQVLSIADGQYATTRPQSMEWAQIMIDVRFKLAALLNPAIFAPGKQPAQSQAASVTLNFGDALDALETKGRQRRPELSGTVIEGSRSRGSE